ncbi:hypothetical protein BH18ACT1_BH18ACT1_06420 [soil metagenome]
MTSRFLLTCHDAGGTIPPALALAQALRSRGYPVSMLSQPSVRERAEAAGCRFTAFSTVADYRRDTAIEEQVAVAVPVLTGRSVGDDLLALVEAQAVDVVVVDANLAGVLAAAETLAQPSVVLLHSMYATFVETWFAHIWPLLGTAVNETRGAYGLEPAGSWSALFDGHDRLLSVVPSMFEAPVVGASADVCHHGFLVPEVLPVAETPGFPAGDDPAVLVGLSTTYQHQEPLLRSILEALGSLEVRGLVTTAGHGDLATSSIPANVAVETYVAHSLVLAHTDVMVTHGGLGSLAAALSHGVPVVCAPIGRDQPLNADRVAALDAGLALAVDPTAEELARAVEAVLAQPSYRLGAQAIAAASRSEGGAVAAAAELASLVG